MKSVIYKGNKLRRSGQVVRGGRYELVQDDKTRESFFMLTETLDKLEAEQAETIPTDSVTVIPAIDRWEEVERYVRVISLTQYVVSDKKLIVVYKNLLKLRDELRLEVIQEANELWGLSKE